VYAVRLVEVLLAAGCNVALSISPAGKAVIQQELDRTVNLEEFDPKRLFGESAGKGVLRYHHYLDLFAPIASGSSLSDGMVICPCSGGTLSAIAHGTSANLIHRAADVHLKERRKLILVPRETPLSSIQLDNMKRCADAGAVVLPASPGFYHGARSIDDLVDFIVARICDQFGLQHSLMRRWGERPDT
jgi:4-hydroxy-3-polyprenylbenzoate decarboxylase